MIVWSVVLLLMVFLYKGHRSLTETGPAVAFRSLSSAGITIRIRGDVPHPGIYRFPDGASLVTVTNMTILKPVIIQSAGYTLNTVVKSGMIVDFKRVQGKTCVITVDYMKAKERMTLGIPLDLRLMNESDWDGLPGIGAKTARNIVVYRQNNGDFTSLDELKKIPGISDVKFRKLESFFSSP